MASKLLRCQFDSYLKQLTTKVVKCNLVSNAIRKEFKTKISKDISHAIQLEDSILFCEGGGQPADKGTIDELKVFYVGRYSDGTVLVG